MSHLSKYSIGDMFVTSGGGTAEILAPGYDHEFLKKGRLVGDTEFWACRVTTNSGASWIVLMTEESIQKEWFGMPKIVESGEVSLDDGRWFHYDVYDDGDILTEWI